MNSNLARQAEAALIEAARRLTPEERLNTFLEHSRLITKLYEAGIHIGNRRFCLLRHLNKDRTFFNGF